MEDEHHLEKAFRHREKKDVRQQRHIDASKDRSKFKKTDQKQYQKKRKEEAEKVLSKEHLKEGQVIAIRSEGVIISHKNALYTCVLRGILKKERRQRKNILTVGDYVHFEETTLGEGVIVHVNERNSVLSRAETLCHRQEQLIAANIDQVLIIMSVVIPPLKPSLIDRYIIATLKGNMEPILVINKIDLLQNDEETVLYQACIEAYQNIPITVIAVSAETGKGLDTLRNQMKDRSSVFAGQSGVGKSSLINAMTDLHLPVGLPVEKTKKGAHTTSSSELLPLDFGGWCIDTPGIKSFGMWDLEKSEIKDYYPEFSIYQCHFLNCIHIHEPDCAVKKAVEEGVIPQLRYDSYYNLVDTIEQEHKPR